MTYTEVSSKTLPQQSPLVDIIQFAEAESILYSLDPRYLGKVKQDFGRLKLGDPLCLLKPRNSHELTAIVQEANLKGYSLTPRGRGLSQSGQSISHGGISLDLDHFSDIEIDLANQQAICGANVTWRELVTHCSALGYLPYVMPLNLGLTIAGTLSVGGLGASSFRFGPAIAHVDSLEVITGKGEQVNCSAYHRKEVFHAALGGLGRCGVITSLTLNLRPFKTRVRTYYLLYDNLEDCLADQQLLAGQEWANYVEGFCSSSVQGLKLASEGRRPLFHWQYGLHVSIEVDGEKTEVCDTYFTHLSHQKLLLVEETDTIEFLSRYDVRFQQMRLNNEWNKAHPWFECLLSTEKAKKLIPQFLAALPDYFGSGHRIMYLPKTNASPLFMQPDVSSYVAFAVLPTGIDSDNLPDAVTVLDNLNETLVCNGGKRYLSGWLGSMNAQKWQQHFGRQYGYWQSLKLLLDPNHVLQSVLFNGTSL